MSETDRQHLIENIVGSMKGARRDIQERMIKHFFKVDPEYGGRIAKGLGLPTESAKLWLILLYTQAYPKLDIKVYIQTSFLA